MNTRAWPAAALMLLLLAAGCSSGSHEVSASSGNEVSASSGSNEASPASGNEVPASSGSNEVSAGCVDAMAHAAAEPDVTAADPLIEQTLDVCVDAVEWTAALQQHPEAMGLESPEYVDDFAVYTACGNDRESRVCADAAERGVLD